MLHIGPKTTGLSWISLRPRPDPVRLLAWSLQPIQSRTEALAQVSSRNSLPKFLFFASWILNEKLKTIVQFGVREQVRNTVKYIPSIDEGWQQPEDHTKFGGFCIRLNSMGQIFSALWVTLFGSKEYKIVMVRFFLPAADSHTTMKSASWLFHSNEHFRNSTEPSSGHFVDTMRSKNSSSLLQVGPVYDLRSRLLTNESYWLSLRWHIYTEFEITSPPDCDFKAWTIKTWLEMAW